MKKIYTPSKTFIACYSALKWNAYGNQTYPLCISVWGSVIGVIRIPLFQKNMHVIPFFLNDFLCIPKVFCKGDSFIELSQELPGISLP